MTQNNSPSRLWFLSKDCRQVPPEVTGGKILWAHPEGYFLNAQGQKLAHTFCPAMQVSKPNMHAAYPKMRQFGNRLCHTLMAMAFYGARPTFISLKTGREYVGICHHLIPDKLDYRPANLLCWLTREQHYEADRRQRALRKIVPDGDLHIFHIDRLRTLQDPRVTSREAFESTLASIAAKGYHRTDPHARMDYELTHHMEL